MSHDSALYGAQRSLLDLLGALDRTRFEPHVVAPYAGALTERLAALDVPVTVSPLAYWLPPINTIRPRHIQQMLGTAPARLARLVHIIGNCAIDVVYSNTIVSIDGAIGSFLARRPHIWHVREYVTGNSQLRPLLPPRVIARVVLAASRRVIVNSQSLRSALFPAAAHDRVVVIHNGVNLDAFAAPAGDGGLRAEIGLAPTAKLVAAVGSVIPRKGLETLVRAAARVAASVEDVHWLVVGEGDEHHRDELAALAGALGVDARVHWLGWRPDVPRILAGIDVLAAPSMQEAFGRSIVEAMSAGRPVVATRSGGPAEIVVDGETGRLVAVGDAEAMADALVELLRHPERGAAMGAAGRRRAEAMFGCHTHARRVEAVICGAATAPGRG